MPKGKKSLAPNPAEPPLVITKTDGEAWDDEADAVVVGFGGAGACAALEASANGARVLVLDRFHGGGATAISGGVFYAGGGTHIQSEAGATDDADEMFRYLSLEVKGVVAEETLRDFCDTSVDNLTWLEEHGVPFEASLCPYKTSYPTDDYYLYYSGNEGFSPYKEAAKPAPRGHRAKGAGLPGESFYEPLRASAHRAGIQVEYEARVTRLVIDSRNRVLGVEYRQIKKGFWSSLYRRLNQAGVAIVKYNPKVAAKLRERCFQIEADHSVLKRVRAIKGVVLAAGGFIYNRDMVKEIAPKYRSGMPLEDRPHGPHLGMAIHQPAGGIRQRDDHQPERRAVHQRVHVRRRGGRSDGRELKKLAREQCKPGKAQWFQRAPALLNLWFNSKEAKTVDELAKVAKVPLETLRKTLDEYNDAADGKMADRFNKGSDRMHAMRNGPYFAINAGIKSKTVRGRAQCGRRVLAAVRERPVDRGLRVLRPSCRRCSGPRRDVRGKRRANPRAKLSDRSQVARRDSGGPSGSSRRPVARGASGNLATAPPRRPLPASVAQPNDSTSRRSHTGVVIAARAAPEAGPLSPCDCLDGRPTRPKGAYLP